MSTAIEKTPDRMTQKITKIRGYLQADSVKERMSEMLGKRAGAFSNSIINVAKNSQYLLDCTPDSIMNAALIAASMNLPVDPSLGYAAIVPYKHKGTQLAQFQLMYKGQIQLCIRSGQYKTITATEIYSDEIKSYNPITGDIEFNDPEIYKLRDSAFPGDVVGFYARFQLISGFECSIYWTKDRTMSHAERFSKSYQYDLRESKKTSLWSTDPISMGKKTVLKQLLGTYGIMSIEMQDAFIEDNKSFDNVLNHTEEVVKNTMASRRVEVSMVEPEPETPEQETMQDDNF